MKEFIENKLRIIRNNYLEDHDRIISDYNKEIREIDGYKGRQILELLQNADDACITVKERKVKIVLSGNTLEIANNGEPFTEDGIVSLMYSNLSPKAAQQNKIGNKGTGFRSILSWANCIYIQSGALSVNFSKAHAEQFLMEMLVENPAISNVFRKVPGCKYPIATLVVPKWEERSEDYRNAEEYDTRIVLELKDGVEQEIIKQLREIDSEVLLFLNNIEILTVESPEGKRVIRKVLLTDKETEITIFDGTGALVSRKKWHIKKAHGQFKNRNYDIAIAYNDHLDDNRNVLYSYFQTDVEFPFPALIHGTFNLNADRNHLLKDNEENNHILEQLINLLIETAEEITNQSSIISYHALSLLCFEDHFSREIEEMGFREKLLAGIRQAKLFPTVNGEYVTCEKLPYFYNRPLADFCSGPDFHNLLSYTEDQRVLKLLSHLGIKDHHYPYEYLVKAINKMIAAGQLSMEQRVFVLTHLLAFYNRQMNNDNKGARDRIQIPYLLLDNEGKTIKGDTVFVNPSRGEQIASPPSFARIKFLHPQMLNMLSDHFKHDELRNLVSRLRVFNVHEYAFEQVANRVITQARRQLKIANKPAKTNRIVRELAEWLYQVYTTDEKAASRPFAMHVPLLNKDGVVMDAHHLYFGLEYGNTIGYNLLHNIIPDKFIAEPAMLGLAGDTKDGAKVKDFLRWLGVALYPRMGIQELEPAERKAFLDHTIQRFGSDILIGDCHYDSFDKFLNDFRLGGGHYFTKVQASCFEYLDQILSSCETKHILDWFKSDPAVIEMLHKRTESNPLAKAGFKLGYKSNLRYLNGDKYESYFLWKIRSKPWITVKNGGRSAPERCCLARNIGTEFSPYVEMPDIDLLIGETKDKRRAREELESTLELAGVAREFTALDVGIIYEVLLQLPEGRIDEKNVRSFYRQIIQNTELTEWEKRNGNVVEFLKNGRVLAEYKGEKLYMPVQDVFYLDELTVCSDVLYRFPILQLERRRGKDKVEKLLGVKPFANVVFKLKNNPKLHALQRIFEQDLRNFLPYIYCYRLEKDSRLEDLTVLKGMEVYLCVEIHAEYKINGETYNAQIKDYEFIETDNGRKVYLKIPEGKHGNIEHLRRDFSFCQSIAYIITSLLDVEGNFKDFRDLYGKDEARRRETIRSDFDDPGLDVLMKSRTHFQQYIDHKLEFWKSVMSAMKLEVDQVFQFEDLVNQTGANFPISPDILTEYSERINFGDLESVNNAPHLISLFRELGIDIDTFNCYSEIQLNLVPFYQEQHLRLIQQYEPRYASWLYEKLRKESVTSQQNFDVLKSQFRELPVTFRNTVHFNGKVELFKTLQVDLDTVEDVDLNHIYFENRKLFAKENALTGYEIELFLGESRNHSLMYFKAFDTLKERLAEFRELTLIEEASTFNLTKDDLLDVGKYEIEDLDLAKPEIVIRDGSPRKSGGGNGSVQRRLKKSDANGLLGEKLAYEMLKKTYEKDRVIWVSENAKKAGVNAEGRDGLGYDFRIERTSGEVIFVEVKATTGSELVFYISEEELVFAEKNSTRHMFLVITELKNEANRKFYRIENLFSYKENESRYENDRFLLENCEYCVRMTGRPNSNKNKQE